MILIKSYFNPAERGLIGVDRTAVQWVIWQVEQAGYGVLNHRDQTIYDLLMAGF